MIHYNNTGILKNGNSEGTAGDGLDCTDGVDSSNGAMIFGDGTATGPGNQALIDIWTFATGERLTVPLENEKIIVTEQPVAAIEGRIFYDADNNGVFELGNGDFAYVQTEVEVSYSYPVEQRDENGEPKKDADGNIVYQTRETLIK